MAANNTRIFILHSCPRILLPPAPGVKHPNWVI